MVAFDLLEDLGCLGKNGKQEGSKEQGLLQEIWTCLDVQGAQEEIAVGDLKVFLMAIFGIKGNKRLEI